MILEYSGHILTTHLALGFYTSFNILKTGILVENIYSKLNMRYFLFETKNWILISFPQYIQGQMEDGTRGGFRSCEALGVLRTLIGRKAP